MRFLSALSLSILLLFSFGAVASAAQLLDDASDQEITEAGYLTDDELAGAVGDPDPGGNLVSGLTVQAVSPDLKYAPYIGSGWIIGTASGLGEVYVYVPISSRGSWGTTDDGYLCNVGASSVSGVMFTASGTKYSFSCSSFSVPRYRLYDGSGYQYSDLYLTVTGSNLDVATTFPGSYTFVNSWPYIVIGLMGVILVCMMRYKR